MGLKETNMMKNHCYKILIESDEREGYADVYNGTTRVKHFVGFTAITEAAAYISKILDREYPSRKINGGFSRK